MFCKNNIFLPICMMVFTMQLSFYNDSLAAEEELKSDEFLLSQERDILESDLQIYKDKVFDGLDLDKIKKSSVLLVNDENEVRVFNEVFETGAMVMEDGIVESGNLKDVRDLDSSKPNQDISELQNNQNQILDFTDEERPELVKTFYFSSVIATKDKEWTLWLNGKKFRKSKNKIEGIEIKNVKDNTAEVYYHLNDLSIQFPSNSEDIKKIPQEDILKYNQSGDYRWDYKSLDERVFIDSNNKIIRFKLKIGQIFSIDDFKIYDDQRSLNIASNTSNGSSSPTDGNSAKVLNDNKQSSIANTSQSEREDKEDVFDEIVNKYKIKK